MTRAIGVLTTWLLVVGTWGGCTSDPLFPAAADAASADVRAEEENGPDAQAPDAQAPDTEAEVGPDANEAAPDVKTDEADAPSDGGALDGDVLSDGDPADGGAPSDGGALDGDVLSDGDFSDDAVCDRQPPIVKIGCQETPLPPTLTVDGVSTQVVGYACSAENVDTLVRIRACVSPPHNACLADAGESFCAVVDIPSALLESFVPDGTLKLDGTTAFTFLSPFDSRVRPENVVYTPAQMNGLTRVWMESECFCTPIPPLVGSQTVHGGLTINAATSQRVIGRIVLSADGHISPVNYRQRQIDLSIFFDVPRAAP